MDTINMHSHLFTSENSPEKFLELYLPGFLARGVDTFTNGKIGAFFVKKIIPRFGNLGKRYASFLEIGKSAHQGDVLDKLIPSYPPATKFVALSLFMDEMGVGKSKTGYEGQLEQLILLKKRFPNELLIYLCIDPRWQPARHTTLLDAVQYYLRYSVKVKEKWVKVFNGLKLYPSTGFYVFDERLMPTLEWASEQQLPIVTHTNYLGGVFNNDANYLKMNLNPTLAHYGADADYNAFCARTGYHSPSYQMVKSSFMKRLMGMAGEKRNMVTCSFFLEPFSYLPVLEYFNGPGKKPLKLCFAHYGGNIQIQLAEGKNPKGADDLERNPVGIGNLNWTIQIRKLMQQFPGVYTDISYAYTDKETHCIIYHDVAHQSWADRILFGTDYYMTEREGSEKNNLSTFRQFAMEKTLPSGKSLWTQMMENNQQFIYP